MQRRGYRNVINLPLRDGNRTFGTLTLYSGEVLHLVERDLDVLQEMADDLAFGIGNIRSHGPHKGLSQATLHRERHHAVSGIPVPFFVGVGGRVSGYLTHLGGVG